ncbi:hypothetical protein SNOG_00724 [Parastagonospora nodorum SN15]|uniref:Uncharacterized protein n=1 Tax=Phaeosphaeria nodorum (strain SN15 / ATCC MYA-4574 / FGSC 10173) TaxID=321614 RepID=Q0V5J0_PHANO|nr:hypothetical protein SNOG_00724 [Parastagonospora nodorum SN15]EAT92219.1 hypothetical protein SNOG_00724 [Parastagonospora nodorum SN15]
MPGSFAKIVRGSDVYTCDVCRLDRILTRWRKSDVDSDLFGYRQEPSEPAPNLK